MLAENDFPEQAAEVRKHIIDKFASSSNAEIAKTAAQLAGSVNYDQTDKLLRTILQGGEVAVARWTESANQLIAKSPDILTARYLAGAALEFEALGNEELTVATYKVMSAGFTQQDNAIRSEVEIALKARTARREVIGQQFDPELDATDDKPISMSNYAGKIVLMPFWANNFPGSMQVIPVLMKLQKKYPDKIAIVGMNLDPANTKFDPYHSDHLGFRSFKSTTGVSQTAPNPVASRFGVVSMPFVAILGQDHKIAALDFTGSRLESTIIELLKQ